MAATVSLWSNVGVAIQSALATAITFGAGGVTKANPGVMTYTGTDPSNGDYIVVTSVGMTEIDGRIFRVANVNSGANTLELEGENTTSYGTAISGSAQVITFGTTLVTATSVTGSGGDFDFIDVTTIHDTVKKQIPGAAAASVFSFENIWDVGDAGLVALKAAADVKGLRAVKFTFANAYKFLFTGYIGCTLQPTGQAQDKVTTPVVITGFGRPTVYST